MARSSHWRDDQKLLGAALHKFEHDVVLKIGDDVWTRYEIATVLGHTHVAAARKLSKFFSHGRYANAKDAAKHVTLDELAARKGLGPTTIFVWMSVLDLLRKDPLAWLDWKGGTLSTLQNRARRPKRKADVVALQKQAG